MKKQGCRRSYRRRILGIKRVTTRGIKRVTFSSSGTGKGSPPTATPTTTTTTSRRINSRTLLPVVLVLGIVLPFLFVRIAFLVLESTTACSSPLGTTTLSMTHIYVSIYGTRICSETYQKLREELTRALVEAKDGNIYEEGIESFNELVREMTSKRQDVKAFALKTKAMSTFTVGNNTGSNPTYSVGFTGFGFGSGSGSWSGSKTFA
uniref:Uncharacterized protein n=1 Tax=Fagus sylvatica TaxID=28930 RepID=A0A2N9FBX1_FAGSY